MGKKGKRKPQFMKRHITPNTGVLAEYHSHMRSAKRGEIVPRTIGMSAEQLAVKVQIQQMTQVQTLHQLWISDRHQGLNNFHYVLHVHPIWGRIKLFFSGARYLWVQEKLGYARLSIEYHGKAAAMRAYDRNRITWIERYTPG